MRVEARHLRGKLGEYYACAGADKPVRITVKSRTYVPEFGEPRRASASVAVALSDPPPSWSTVYGIGIVAELFAVGWATWVRLDGDGPAEPSIAVLPFENLSSDPEQEYFSDGFTDTLIVDLARVDGRRVSARGSVMAYKGSRQSLARIGKQLDVSQIIEGTC